MPDHRPLDDLCRELRAAAEAATPGPWEAYHHFAGCTVANDEKCGCGLSIEGPPEATNRGQFERGADATFIALANPATLLRLLDERTELKRDRERFEKLKALLRAQHWDVIETGSTLSLIQYARA